MKEIIAKLLTVQKKFVLFILVRNGKRTAWRKYMLMLGCKGLHETEPNF